MSRELISRYEAAMMNTFGKPKRVFVKGEGTRLIDADGRSYLDLLGGIAVNVLGHAHAEVNQAIVDQLQTLGHISNFFASPPQIELAERLIALRGIAGKVFFANSGTEANEAAFKLTRRRGKTKLVAMEGGFHGRSLGALALTYKPAYRKPFEPLPGDVQFIPYGDVDALAAAVDDEVAAVVVEPLQGEAGVIVAPDGFLAAARDITQRHSALLWIDEVQTGIGRCGDWFAHSASDVVPDIVTLAKGLGNGFPIGACLAFGPAQTLLEPGNHGTTFGGNPVAARAGLAVLDIVERDGLLLRASESGQRFRESLRALEHPMVKDVRGRGQLNGIEFVDPIAPALVEAGYEAGFVLNAANEHTLRLAPALIITDEELDSFVEALPTLIERART